MKLTEKEILKINKSKHPSGCLALVEKVQLMRFDNKFTIMEI
jgi:hypothetical protein